MGELKEEELEFPKFQKLLLTADELFVKETTEFTHAIDGLEKAIKGKASTVIVLIDELVQVVAASV